MLDQILTPKALREAQLSAISESRKEKSPFDQRYLERFFKIIDFSEYIIEHINEAKHVMRDKTQFYDLVRYQLAKSILELGSELASLPHYPTLLATGRYENPTKFKYKELLKATKDRRDNFYFKIFRDKVVPQILNYNPLLVGISLVYSYQIIPAFTLSRLLKIQTPYVHVVLGGSMISLMESHLLNDSRFFNFADSYVIGEGETALLKLATNLLLKKELSDVPNLIYELNGASHYSNPGWVEPTENICTPDYDGLNLNSYLSPEPVLLLTTTRGCYYGKCAFCNVSLHRKGRFRQISKERIKESLITLHKKYNCQHLFFCDDSLPLSSMREIVKTVRDYIPDARWAGEARFEKSLTKEVIPKLKEGGCRLLVFGLESASQRLLNVMKKDNEFDHDLSIIHTCAKNGIRLNLQAFVGFPTETKEEAWKTIDFLVDNEKMIASFGLSQFRLLKDTPAFNFPRDYGVREVRDPEDEDIFIEDSYPFVADSGMNQKDVKKVFLRGLEKLRSFYAAKSNFMDTPVGAHSLLYFSHYNAEILDQLWKKWRAPYCSVGAEIHNLVMYISPNILLSPRHSSDGFGCRVLCTKTGRQFQLSPEERQLLELIDGKLDVTEITSLWVDRKSQEFEERILLLARAYGIIKEFLINGIVRTKL